MCPAEGGADECDRGAEDARDYPFPGCALEAIMFECPGPTWNRVFCEVDRMS